MSGQAQTEFLIQKYALQLQLGAAGRKLVNLYKIITVTLLSTILAACNQKPTGADAPAISGSSTDMEPAVSINALMGLHVDPAADAIWDSVKVISDSTGRHEYHPSSSREWADLEQKAQTLVSASKLLKTEDRAVTAPGASITPGTLTAPEIQRLIAANRAEFNARADKLGQVAVDILAAIKARNVDKITELGGQLDEACELCHKQFYYPNRAPPRTIP
jgi:hypothetical protein